MPGCKPGDTAIIFRTKAQGATLPAELLGRPVKVLSVRGRDPVNNSPPFLECEVEPFIFVSRSPISTANGNRHDIGASVRVLGLPDAMLSPIRPSDAPDETLAWKAVPKPARVTSPAANDPSYAP